MLYHLLLLWRIFYHDFKHRYFGSFLGIYWNLIHPMITILIFVIVFRDILKIRVPGFAIERVSYGEFFVCGMIPWIAINENIRDATNIFLGENVVLIKEFPIPKLLIFIKNLLFIYTNMLVAFAIFFTYLLANNSMYFSTLPFLLLIILVQVTCTLGLSLISGSIGSLSRDIREFIVIFMNLLFFVTPIIYPAELIPRSIRWLIYLNPFTHVIDAYKNVILSGEAPQLSFYYYFVPFSVVALIGGLLLVRRLDTMITEMS